MSVFEKVIELAKRRGIFWPSYEIYGGVSGLYDIGPVGTKIKNRIIELWRKIFIKDHSEFVVEIETPIITPYKVLEASGHVENFTDPIVECTKCKRVYRADHLIEELIKINAEGLTIQELNKIIKEKAIKCPNCGGELSDVRLFNLLFQTTIGPVSGNIGFLRPETAQGMFTSFKRVYESIREKLPLGIAQVGRVGRNEISPRQGLIRMREFTIMEMEFFIDPEDPHPPPLDRFRDYKLNILRGESKLRGEKPQPFKLEELVNEKVVINPWMAYWMAVSNLFVEKLGIKSENIYFEEKLPYERAHYSSQTFDQIVVIEGDKIEVAGHAYRSDYDLSRHSKFSGQDLSVFKKYDRPKITKKKIVVVNMNKVNNEGKEFAKKIISIINTNKIEEIEKMISQGVTIEGKPLSQYIQISEREEKITGTRFIPHVVEPSFGVERLMFITLVNSYRQKKERIILSLPREIVPYHVAIFPLLEREEFIKKSKEIYNILSEKFDVLLDISGSIGKRYARADEIGVSYAVTIDYDTFKNNTVTIRDRDTWDQIRVKVDDLINVLEKLFKGEEFQRLGVIVRGEEK
jgi:glycyl-tRNA synthetase